MAHESGLQYLPYCQGRGHLALCPLTLKVVCAITDFCLPWDICEKEYSTHVIFRAWMEGTL